MFFVSFLIVHCSSCVFFVGCFFRRSFVRNGSLSSKQRQVEVITKIISRGPQTN